MSEEKKADDQKKKAPQTPADKLKELLQDFEDAPSGSDIDGLKAKHGDLFVSALSDDELFIFRAITRKEHRSINAQIAEGKLSAEMFDDELVATCLLWTSVKDLSAKAGTVPSLVEQIMQNSNFLPPQLLASLVTKL